jgi:hypothetical protein
MVIYLFGYQGHHENLPRNGHAWLHEGSMKGCTEGDGGGGVVVAESTKADIAVTFHVSADTNPSELDDSFTPFFVNLFKHARIEVGDVRVAMSYYRKNPTLMFNLEQHSTRKAFNKAVDKIDRKVRGKNNDAGEALIEFQNQVFVPSAGDRPDVPNVVIVVTNNEVNIQPESFQKAAADLKAQGVKIITVGIGAADRNQLRGAASEPADQNSIYFANLEDIRTDEAAGRVRNLVYACESGTQLVLHSTTLGSFKFLFIAQLVLIGNCITFSKTLFNYTGQCCHVGSVYC